VGRISKCFKIKDSHSTEFQKTKNPVVGLMTEWFKNNVKINRNEDLSSTLGS
jgi:CTP synthase (UTP-ammonia lyase)